MKNDQTVYLESWPSLGEYRRLVSRALRDIAVAETDNEAREVIHHQDALVSLCYTQKDTPQQCAGRIQMALLGAFERLYHIQRNQR